MDRSRETCGGYYEQTLNALWRVARESNHANQKTIHITPMHGKAKENSKKVSFISSILNKIKKVAEQFNPVEIWKRVLSMIFVKFLKGRILGEGNWMDIEILTDARLSPEAMIGVT
jgi:hypothetical protein